MADSKITDLTPPGALTGAEVVYLVQSGNDVKSTTAAIAALAGGSPSFTTITGGTNITAAMVVGTGASLAASGSGTITATAVPVGGVTGLGTGVATALGVNAGTAGAFVVNGGALGTPSSGVATNLTGTAAALNIGGTAANATNTAITDDTTTNAAMNLTWVTTNSGNLPQKVSSTKLNFNPSTGVLSSTSFTGAGTGLTGTAASLTAGTATNATNVATTSTATNASFFPLFVASSSNSNQAVNLDTTFTYNPSTDTLTATNFAGNATTSTTATNATNVAITNDTATATACFPTWVTANTGNLPLKVTSTKLSFVPSTGATTITSADANAFTVGLAGATNPAIQIDASTASSDTGFAFKSGVATFSGTLISSATNAGGTWQFSKGSATAQISGSNLFQVNAGGTLQLMSGGSVIQQVFGAGCTFGSNFRGFQNGTNFTFSGSTDSNLTSSAEALDMDLNFSQVKTHGTGALTTQRSLIYRPSTHAYAAASAITNVIGWQTVAMPLAGANCTATNIVGTDLVGGATTTGGGTAVTAITLRVGVPTGASTTNIAAQFNGSVDMAGNSLLNAVELGGVVASDFAATSNTTLANVTGLTATVAAAGKYTFTVYLETTSNVAGGLKVAMGGTATMTTYRATTFAYTATTVGKSTNTTFGGNEFAVTAVTADTLTIMGTLIVNAAGTVTVQFAQNASNAAASTVLAGSNFTLIRVG